MLKKNCFLLKMWILLISLAIGLTATNLKADVIKPALVEVSFLEDNEVEVSIMLSLEAAMSGISTKYKDTKNSPNASSYDELRILDSETLGQKFRVFNSKFKKTMQLNINGKPINLKIKKVKIDDIGYIKRSRKTILLYTATLPDKAESIFWQYDKIYGDNAFRYRFYKKDTYSWNSWLWLRNGEATGTIELDHIEPPSFMTKLIKFIGIGFDHVIPLGLDHVLFIIGMAMSTLLWKQLTLLVTTFTLAHTLTLGLAMLNIVAIPASIIEPLIALSISYVAIENIFMKHVAIRKTILVFLFGLLHGIGFASMLKTFDTDNTSFITTLIGFNIGVEVAQILIVLGVVMILLVIKTAKLNHTILVVRPVSILIALIGLYWAFDRVF